MPYIHLLPVHFQNGEAQHTVDTRSPQGHASLTNDLYALTHQAIREADDYLLDLIIDDEHPEGFISANIFAESVLEIAYARTALKHISSWDDLENRIPEIMANVAQSYAERGFVTAQGMKGTENEGIWIRPEGSLELV